jgi:hypothetical protein
MESSSGKGEVKKTERARDHGLPGETDPTPGQESIATPKMLFFFVRLHQRRYRHLHR